VHVFYFHPVKRRKAMLLILFLSILFVPGVTTGWIGGFVDGPSENRKLASLPSLSLDFESFKSLPSSIDHYMSDHFGFRKDLILMYNWIKFDVFNTSPNETVIIGQDKWLYKYLAEQKGEVRVPPLMRRQWRVHFEERQDWLQEQGIDFAVVVASNKHTIYPEYLPSFYQPELKKSKLNQFLAEVKNSRLNVIDLTPRLLEEKEERLIYYKTDTHWNFYGAYFGYREIADDLQSFFPEQDMIDLGTASIQSRQRDTNLYRIMGVNGTENADYIVPEGGWGFKEHQADTKLLKHIAKRGSVSVTEHKNQMLPKAVVIGDSYLGWNRNFLAQHFGRGVFVNLWGSQWKHKETFPLDLFREEEPELVLMQFKESRLGFCPKPYCVVSPKKMTNPDAVRQARLRRLYGISEAAGKVVSFKSANSAKAGERHYQLNLGGVDANKRKVLIAKVVINEHKHPVTLFAKNGGARLCNKYKEVERVTLTPGENSALLCLDAGTPLELSLKGRELGTVGVSTVVARPHADLPRKGHWKKRQGNKAAVEG